MGGYVVKRQAARRLEPHASVAGSAGLEQAILVDRTDGSAHVELALCRLQPGGHIGGHLHPFEESFYVLAGRALLALDHQHHELRRDDFGFAPVATPHAWSNPFDEPFTWYCVRSPQPRPIGRSRGTFPLRDFPVPEQGRPAHELHPLSRYVGHFADTDLGAPGPLTMPGAHGHDIRDVSIRMMVDDVLGSIHHQTFMVQFAPTGEDRFSGSAHFHDFEEAYFVVAGAGEVELEGERFRAQPGDLVWEAPGVMHAWRAVGDDPLRFIELMAPRPPYTNMLFSEKTWSDLAEETLGSG